VDPDGFGSIDDWARQYFPTFRVSACLVECLPEPSIVAVTKGAIDRFEGRDLPADGHAGHRREHGEAEPRHEGNRLASQGQLHDGAVRIPHEAVFLAAEDLEASPLPQRVGGHHRVW